MATDPWSTERMRLISDAVLERSARRFRDALHHLGDSHQSEPVKRLQRGLRAMQDELMRRGLTQNTTTSTHGDSSPSGDGSATQLGGTSETNLPTARWSLGDDAPLLPDASSSHMPPSRQPASRNGSSDKSPQAEEAEDTGEASSKTSKEPEPVWRLIPHLSGTASKVVSILDDDGTIRYQTDPIKWLLGFDADVLLGEPLTSFLCPNSKSQAEEHIARMADHEEKFDCWRLQFCTASGGTLWLEGMASNFLRDPRLGGILVYWRELKE